jgi:hypothetical protein
VKPRGALNVAPTPSAVNVADDVGAPEVVHTSVANDVPEPPVGAKYCVVANSAPVNGEMSTYLAPILLRTETAAPVGYWLVDAKPYGAYPIV